MVRTHPGIYPPPHGFGAKKRFWGSTLTEHISATEHRPNINNRIKTCQSTGTPLCMPLNLVNFGTETAENGWLVFAHPPLHFCIGRHCQPYRMDVMYQTTGKLWHMLCSGTSLQSRTTAMPGRLSLSFAVHLILYLLSIVNKLTIY